MIIFENAGDPAVFLSSADFMPRNFDTRVETIFPVYEKKLRQQLVEYFSIQWSDTTKARILDRNLENRYRPAKKGEKARAQFAIETYLREKN
jgi:polyphosphate kinase